jgi:hypothetical protein
MGVPCLAWQWCVPPMCILVCSGCVLMHACMSCVWCTYVHSAYLYTHACLYIQEIHTLHTCRFGEYSTVVVVSDTTVVAQIGSGILIHGGVGAPSGSAYLLQSNATKVSWLDVSTIVKSAKLDQVTDGVTVSVPPLFIMYGLEAVKPEDSSSSVTIEEGFNATQSPGSRLVRSARAFSHCADIASFSI